MNCPKCGTKRESNAIRICVNCKHDFGNVGGHTSSTPQTVKMDATQQMRVVVDDIKMDFISMVAFMVKWAIASIPAVIILFLTFWGLVLFLGISFRKFLNEKTTDYSIILIRRLTILLLIVGCDRPICIY